MEVNEREQTEKGQGQQKNEGERKKEEVEEYDRTDLS